MYGPDYPLPIDPISGIPWWKINIAFIFTLPGWHDFQSHKSMDTLIPILNWLHNG